MSRSYEAFRRHLETFGIERVDPDSPLGEVGRSAQLCSRWVIAMDRALRHWTPPPSWVRDRFHELKAWTSEEPARRDQRRAAAAELDAALRLRWIGDVPKPKASGADFEVGDMRFEVYCPQQHRAEREVVEAELAPNEEDPRPCVKMTVSHPHIGSGRVVADDGSVVKDPERSPLKFPANKLIDRVLNSKRKAHQFSEGSTTLLWLDLKHGMQMSIADCTPVRSLLAKGTCFLGTHGVWHAFYGDEGCPLLAKRSVLEFGGAIQTYKQRRQGWFRETESAAGAVLSTADGVLLFENPWAAVPLDAAQRAQVMRLSELRPEGCWLRLGALGSRVEQMLSAIAYLAHVEPGE